MVAGNYLCKILIRNYLYWWHAFHHLSATKHFMLECRLFVWKKVCRRRLRVNGDKTQPAAIEAFPKFHKMDGMNSCLSTFAAATPINRNEMAYIGSVCGTRTRICHHSRAREREKEWSSLHLFWDAMKIKLSIRTGSLVIVSYCVGIRLSSEFRLWGGEINAHAQRTSGWSVSGQSGHPGETFHLDLQYAAIAFTSAPRRGGLWNKWIFVEQYFCVRTLVMAETDSIHRPLFVQRERQIRIVLSYLLCLFFFCRRSHALFLLVICLLFILSRICRVAIGMNAFVSAQKWSE